MAQLQVMRGDRLLQGFALTDRPVTVGRGHEADVRIGDPSLARRHCRLEIEDGRVVVTDLETGGGVFYRGERVATARLEPGDEFAVGEIRVALLPGLIGGGGGGVRPAARAAEAVVGEDSSLTSTPVAAPVGRTVGEDTTCYLEGIEAGRGPSLHAEAPRGMRECASRLERLVEDLAQLYDDLARATTRDPRYAPFVHRLKALTIEAEALVAD